MELTLLRHAPLPAMYHGRYIGHTDIMIDDTLFERDKIEHLLNQTFDRIYSSDLVRCTATLEIMGMKPFTTDSRLREVRFKPSIEGKSFFQIEAMDDFTLEALDSKENWHQLICEESSLMFQSRIENFLQDLPRESKVLICTHGGTIGMILALITPDYSDIPLGYLEYITVSLG